MDIPIESTLELDESSNYMQLKSTYQGYEAQEDMQTIW
jgi:hypothetical protein